MIILKGKIKLLYLMNYSMHNFDYIHLFFFVVFISSSSSCLKTNVNENNLSNPVNLISSNNSNTETSETVLSIKHEEINDALCLSIHENNSLFKQCIIPE